MHADPRAAQRHLSYAEWRGKRRNPIIDRGNRYPQQISESVAQIFMATGLICSEKFRTGDKFQRYCFLHQRQQSRSFRSFSAVPAMLIPVFALMQRENEIAARSNASGFRSTNVSALFFGFDKKIGAADAEDFSSFCV